MNTTNTYTFSLQEVDNWKRHLDEEGFVVLKRVADANQISGAVSRMWDFLEGLGTGIRRSSPDTWKNANWPHSLSTGIISQHGIGQSDFLWWCRLIPQVRSVFEQLWGTKDLLVSFDGAGIFRSPEYGTAKSKSKDQHWFHIDQNPSHQPGRCAIQGMLNLLPSKPTDGGFLVLPKSHTYFSALASLKVGLSAPTKRFFSVIEHMDIFDGIKPVKVNADAGDFILWDSRTVHCNVPPRATPLSPKKQISRLVAYICMTPSSSTDDLALLTKLRQASVKESVTTNHWPHYFCPNRNPRFPHKNIPNTTKVSVSPLAESDEAKRLITGSK